MLECKICSKIMEFNYFLMNFSAISIFFDNFFKKLSSFLKNHDFDVSQFCDQVVKIVWRVWCHSVNLTIVTHSQTSPSERSHSSDIDSRKNGFKIRQIDLQNTKTKSSPKNSWWYHGQDTGFLTTLPPDQQISRNNFQSARNIV